MMKYLYGEFSDSQIDVNARLMHGVSDDDYHWETYRRLILDAHAYVKAIFEEV